MDETLTALAERRIRQLREMADNGLTIDAQTVIHNVGMIRRAEVIALCGRLGIVRRVTTRQDAVEAIVRWVCQLRLAIESIQY